ncbi:hypothetical protein TeGR_g10204 [Tetraparma gracilis]|jgi:hypothetical protein|uniref:Uncharacterized protein n=1 Tax=Tetraparma gracilis TaxID=2962635 RepID=A0ABQ6MU94_9STRA|nr:hypothetical protein TeGR_g10204 [Tetraparma gracilis]
MLPSFRSYMQFVLLVWFPLLTGLLALFVGALEACWPACVEESRSSGLSLNSFLPAPPMRNPLDPGPADAPPLRPSDALPACRLCLRSVTEGSGFRDNFWVPAGLTLLLVAAAKWKARSAGVGVARGRTIGIGRREAS